MNAAYQFLLYLTVLSCLVRLFLTFVRFLYSIVSFGLFADRALNSASAVDCVFGAGDTFCLSFGILWSSVESLI